MNSPTDFERLVREPVPRGHDAVIRATWPLRAFQRGEVLLLAWLASPLVIAVFVGGESAPSVGAFLVASTALTAALCVFWFVRARIWARAARALAVRGRVTELVVVAHRTPAGGRSWRRRAAFELTDASGQVWRGRLRLDNGGAPSVGAVLPAVHDWSQPRFCLAPGPDGAIVTVRLWAVDGDPALSRATIAAVLGGTVAIICLLIWWVVR